MRPRVWAALLAALPSLAAAQNAIRGEIRDLATRTPIARATVTLLGDRDSVVRLVTTNDSGRYLIPLPASGHYSIDVRRVGWTRMTTKPFATAGGDSIRTIDFMMERNAVTLDSMVTVETRGVFPMMPGKELVRRHFAQELGQIIYGGTIEKSGLKLSEYLGTLPGLTLAPVWGAGSPVVPAFGAKAISSDQGACLYARVDRQSLLMLMMREAAEHLDEVLKLKEIMAVEVFTSKSEIPKEWQAEAYVGELFVRNNGGKPYVIGNSGFPIAQDAIDDEAGRYDTRRIALDAGGTISTVARPVFSSLEIGPRPGTGPGGPPDTVSMARRDLSGRGAPSMIPACGLLQIWTARAW